MRAKLNLQIAADLSRSLKLRLVDDAVSFAMADCSEQRTETVLKFRKLSRINVFDHGVSCMQGNQ
jgi:hypothetical protein